MRCSGLAQPPDCRAVDAVSPSDIRLRFARSESLKRFRALVGVQAVGGRPNVPAGFRCAFLQLALELG